MPNGPDADLDAAAGSPTGDTEPDESQDTAPDANGNTVDWEARFKGLQSSTDRQLETLRRELSALNSSDDDEGDDEPEDSGTEPEPEPTQSNRSGSDRLEADSWQLAERVFGGEALSAYERAAPILNRAQTPSDYVAAFEAYHQARLEPPKGKKKAAAAQQPEGDAPPARVESNRPDDQPSRDQLDQQAEAARAKGDLKAYLAAQVARVRGG